MTLFLAFCGKHGKVPDDKCQTCHVTYNIMMQGHQAGDCIPVDCWLCQDGTVPRGVSRETRKRAR